MSAYGRIPLGSGGSQTASRSAGIIDGVSFLSGTLRVNAKPCAFSRRSGRRPEFQQLGRRVKYNVIRILQQFFKFILSVGRAENVHFSLRHFLCSQSGLVQPAGLCSGQFSLKQRIQIKIAERLLGQQDPAAGARCQTAQDTGIFRQRAFVQKITGCGKFLPL